MNRRMAGMVLVLLLLAVAPARAAGAADRTEIRRIVVQEALRSERVPPSLALAVAEAESGFDADAESSAGARGVMQIMPATGQGEFGVAPVALWQPRLNVQLGIAFLDRLIARYGDRWDLALSHYNGGSRVGSGRDARVIPATRGYVDKVLRLERRNARDATVRLMVAAAEAATPPSAERIPAADLPDTRLPATRLPPTRFPATRFPLDDLSGRALAAARLAADGPIVPVHAPAEQRRRFLALAERALAGAEVRERRSGWETGSAALLAGIAARRQRFRALLETLRGG